MDKPIIIDNWQRGISDSPITGFADMRNVDIHSPAGILKIALAPTKISSSTVTALPTWMTTDYASTLNYYFGGGSDGDNAYKIASGVVSTLSGSSINSGTIGGCIWKGYLVVVDYSSSGSETIDVMKLSNGAWTTSFKTLSTSNSNARPAPMIWAQDDILYIGHGRYVASLQELTTFDPASGATYTWTEQALDLPEGFTVESFSELGKNLMIGASRYFGALSQDVYEGRIFPWDRSSTTFGIPIILDKGAARQQISRNGLLVFANGQKGDYLTTNGSFTQDIKSIGSLKNLPSHLTGEIYPEAKSFVGGEYLFGISTSNTGFTPAGIYGFKNGAWRFLQISTGEVGENNTLRIGVIFNKDDRNFYVGWQDTQTGTYGIDEFGSSNYRYTGYKAYVDSELYQIGTPKSKAQLQEFEFTLAKPLATGQGLKLQYRTNLSDSFTDIGTYDYDTLGGVTNHFSKCAVPDTEQVQFRISLTTGSSSTTTPELKNIIFY